jgi:hypothetical protein
VPSAVPYPTAIPDVSDFLCYMSTDPTDGTAFCPVDGGYVNYTSTNRATGAYVICTLVFSVCMNAFQHTNTTNNSCNRRMHAPIHISLSVQTTLTSLERCFKPVTTLRSLP